MLMCLDQSVYAFQWAMENFCKEDDNVVIYHVHHSVLTPVSTLATGAYRDQLKYCCWHLHIAKNVVVHLWKDELLCFAVYCALQIGCKLTVVELPHAVSTLACDMSTWC